MPMCSMPGFPPAPSVIEEVMAYLPWLLRTSPPTQCAGFLQAVAEARGLSLENILPGAGSSDLIFRVLPRWLTPASRVLLLDPTYGEYAHVLRNVIGCRVSSFILRREEGYAVCPHRLHNELSKGWDLAVLVNPNSPTGRHLPREIFADILAGLPSSTRIWVDETYVDYVGAQQSVESLAAQLENVVVCKSMSKAYALSGARVAYLCGSRALLDPLRALTPPWVVGLPSQLAAVRALQAPAYYRDRYAETHRLRERLADDLTGLGWDVVPGVANFLLCHLPFVGPDASELVAACRARGLFLRSAATMGTMLGGRVVRVAVKDEITTRRMVGILREVEGHLSKVGSETRSVQSETVEA